MGRSIDPNSAKDAGQATYNASIMRRRSRRFTTGQPSFGSLKPVLRQGTKMRWLATLAPDEQPSCFNFYSKLKLVKRKRRVTK
jgi:hypothetical protein